MIQYPIFQCLQRQRSVKTREQKANRDREQAGRVAWRQVLRWIQAQLALIETGMVRTEEVFLPYARMKGGVTVFEAVSSGKLLLTSDKAKATGDE